MTRRLAGISTLRFVVAIIVGLALLGPASRGVAQYPDTTHVDTLADTLNQTTRYLEVQEEGTTLVPVMPHIGTSVLQPPGTRFVFDRDSIEWLHGLTLGDLLSQIPGTYLWRGGWYGRTESLVYRGRGATSAEYYLDGAPFLPAGIDSVGVDPAIISLSAIERVEVERLPDRLRVQLFTRRNDRLAPRSRIAITTGDADIARYEGALERRFPSGFGFGLAADYFSSPTIAVQTSRYTNTGAWIQGSYIPNNQFGMHYQIFRTGPNRRPFVVTSPLGNDTLSLGYDAVRTDAQFRVSLRRQTAGVGPALDVLYNRTSWDGGAVDQHLHQVGGIGTLRGPTTSLSGSAWYRSRWTPFEGRGSAAWTPAAGLSGSIEAVYQHHEGGRASRWGLARAGVEPLPGFALTGTARVGREVAAPSILSDTSQALRNYELTAGLRRPRIGVEVSYTRTSAFAPVAAAEFITVPTIAEIPASEWFTLSVRLLPMRWLTLESWFSDPRRVTGIEGLPPTHSITRGTVRSKFLRTFPSGAFDLKLQLSMESWGTGVIGRNAVGTPITLKGATMFRGLVQFQIQRFSFFWDRGNLAGSALGYVPGFRMPSYGTAFGVRWEFIN